MAEKELKEEEEKLVEKELKAIIWPIRELENERVAVECILSDDVRYTFYYVKDCEKEVWSFDGYRGILKALNTERILDVIFEKIRLKLLYI
ncbi:hypothetical protein ETJ91_25910 [Bacillus albus]|uniref:hypothetical protein n=1 Tax=Bacillus albus TaxID=2026189 RepID=UPI001009D8E5|nr:hypothetical protein [Bacillus albus]RXJ13396.1 hypothetical protein ETJ91_25910 [Bacillus albus]RXJ22771.1 hypothetical protein ETJ90_27640 [Bacillus albus]RXJ24946.1 hypothetical protein ETJ76_25305 [Bacillus albus]RXJ36365.1 hypothetical protein ETJ89_25630 [Bacillus albus]RXJ52065.1 hypothetical protein ETJ66_26415 [Bacillus albus]